MNSRWIFIVLKIINTHYNYMVVVGGEITKQSDEIKGLQGRVHKAKVKDH